MNKTAQARAAFITWLQQEHPELAHAAIKYADNKGTAQMHGLAADDSTSWWQKLTEGLTALGTTYLSYTTQQKVLDTNLVRAQQGLPPIDVSAAAPVVRTQVDISPEIADKLAQSGLIWRRSRGSRNPR